MNKKVAIYILFFTLLQLLILAVFGYTPYPDSNGYIDLAIDALSNGELYPVASKISEYEFLWNQGAINMVALSLLITGSVTPLLIVYALMKGATAWFTYDITKKICGGRTAMITLTLYLLYPANYGECTSVHSELPFMFFAMCAVWLSVCKNHHVAAGIMLGMANWMRPMGLLFLVALLLYHWSGWHKSIRLIASYLLILIIIGGVNYQQKHLFMYQAQTGWYALAQYSWNYTPEDRRDTPDPDIVCHDTSLNGMEKDRVWRSMFFEWLQRHPAEYIQQIPKKLVDTYVSDNVSLCTYLPYKQSRIYLYDEVSLKTIAADFPKLNSVQLLTIVNLLYYYLLIFIALYGAFLVIRRYEWKVLAIPATVIIVGTCILIFAGHGETRFHIPFMPFFIMLAALAFTHVNNIKISSTPTYAQ